MKKINQYILEKFKIKNKAYKEDINTPISFDDWCSYFINDLGGIIVPGIYKEWKIGLNIDDSLSLIIFLNSSKDYWESQFTLDKNPIITYHSKDYYINKKDLDKNENGKFLFTRNNAEQIFYKLMEIYNE